MNNFCGFLRTILWKQLVRGAIFRENCFGGEHFRGKNYFIGEALLGERITLWRNIMSGATYFEYGEASVSGKAFCRGKQFLKGKNYFLGETFCRGEKYIRGNMT